MNKSIDSDQLKTMVEDLFQIQNELAVIKEDEMALRKAFANKILNKEVYGEAEKEELIIAGYKVKVSTSESLEIEDKDELVELYLSDELDHEEKQALKIKPDITLARARKLDEDSVLWTYMHTKPSQTPTVKIEEIEE